MRVGRTALLSVLLASCVAQPPPPLSGTVPEISNIIAFGNGGYGVYRFQGNATSPSFVPPRNFFASAADFLGIGRDQVLTGTDGRLGVHEVIGSEEGWFLNRTIDTVALPGFICRQAKTARIRWMAPYSRAGPPVKERLAVGCRTLNDLFYEIVYLDDQKIRTESIRVPSNWPIPPAARHSFEVLSLDLNGDLIDDYIFLTSVAFGSSDSQVLFTYGISNSTSNSYVTGTISAGNAGTQIGLVACTFRRPDVPRDGFAVMTVAGDSYNLAIYHLDLPLLFRGQRFPFGSGAAGLQNINPNPMAIVAGDFDLDGKDELVAIVDVSNRRDIYMWSMVFDTDRSPPIYRRTNEKRAEFHPAKSPYRNNGMFIAQAMQLEDSIFPSVVMVESWDNSDLALKVVGLKDFQTSLKFNVTVVDNDLGRPLSLGYQVPMSLAPANIYTQGLRLGTPRYQRIANITQVLGYIKTPPRHYDIINGVEISVNQNTPESRNVYAGILSTVSRTKSVSVSHKVGIARSTFLELVSPLTLSRTDSVTSSQQYEGSVFESTEESVQSLAVEDDIILTQTVQLDVWEFPVFTLGNVDEPAGFFMIARPAARPLPGFLTAKSIAGFRPFHETNNLLSFPTSPPPDQGVVLSKGVFSYGTVQRVEITQTEAFSSAATRSTSVSVASSIGIDTVRTVELSAAPLGIGVSVSRELGFRAGVEKGYEASSLRTTELSLATSTTLSVNWGNSESNSYNGFQVESWSYYATTGELGVDYSVNLQATPGLNTLWNEFYSGPDFTWNLPFRWDRDASGRFTRNRFFTRDIIVSTTTPSEGEPVNVTARIRNYSYNRYDGSVEVQFYIGDLSTAFGPRHVVHFESQQAAVLNFTATFVPKENPCLFGVIDPDNAIGPETHEDNNVAWVILGRILPGTTAKCGTLIPGAGEPQPSGAR